MSSPATWPPELVDLRNTALALALWGDLTPDVQLFIRQVSALLRELRDDGTADRLLLIGDGRLRGSEAAFYPTGTAW